MSVYVRPFLNKQTKPNFYQCMFGSICRYGASGYAGLTVCPSEATLSVIDWTYLCFFFHL